jgi:hypothetical protein
MNLCQYVILITIVLVQVAFYYKCYAAFYLRLVLRTEIIKEVKPLLFLRVLVGQPFLFEDYRISYFTYFNPMLCA